MSVKLVLIAFLVVSVSSGVVGADFDFVVSTHGNDGWSGTLTEPNASNTDGPFATLARARDAVRVLRQSQPGRTTPVRVLVRAGVYELAETLVLTPADSGTASSPTIYAAYPGESPVVSGGRRLSGWSVDAQGRWQLHIPEVQSGAWNFSQLWVNGERRYRARLPKNGYFLIERQIEPSPYSPDGQDDRFGYAAGDIDPAWSNFGDIELILFHQWEIGRQRIAELDPSNRIVRLTNSVVGDSPTFWGLMPGRRYIVDNVKEALLEPGEWYLDRSSGAITYIPMAGENAANAQVYAPKLDTILRIQGEVQSSGPMVTFVQFHGLTFAHSNYVTPQSGYRCVQVALVVSGAVSLSGAQYCRFENCKVTHTGTYGISLEYRCRHNTIQSCELTDLGAGGIQIERYDQSPWADGSEFKTAQNTVKDCLIAHGGRILPAGAGIVIGQSDSNFIDHNEICDLYWTGVSCGWFYDSGAHYNTITNNRIHHIGQGVLSDMGGVYTLAPQVGTVIRGNIIHDVGRRTYGGWGIYLDEYSAYITAEKNWVYNVQDGGFHIHYGSANNIKNNVFAFSQNGQLYRTRAEDQLQFNFLRNICYWQNTPWSSRSKTLVGDWSGDGYWFDWNVYFDAGGKPVTFAGLTFDQWRAKGQDTNSVIGDPLFVSPEEYDFRLLPGSIAPSLGFVNFDPRGAGRFNQQSEASLARPAFPVQFVEPIPFLAACSVNSGLLMTTDRAGVIAEFDHSDDNGFHGVAFSPSGALFAAVRTNGWVVYYLNGKKGVYCSGPLDAKSLAVDEYGNLFIAALAGGIYRYDAGSLPGGTAGLFISTPPAPRSVACHGGNLWVSFRDENLVRRYDALSGSLIAQYPVDIPYSLTTSPDGTVYVTSGNSVRRFNGSGFEPVFTISATDTILGLAYCDGGLYFTGAGSPYELMFYDLAAGNSRRFTHGGIPGSQYYVAARTYPVNENKKIAELRNAPDGGAVAVDGVVSAVFADAFYLQDSSAPAGIRVEPSPEGLSEGARLKVHGFVGTTNHGERVIRATLVMQSDR